MKIILEKEQLELIDVRNRIDFEIENIENSKNIPFENLSKEQNKIDRSKKIVVICKIGFLSKEAILELNKLGLKDNIFSLKGGISSWKNDS